MLFGVALAAQTPEQAPAPPSTKQSESQPDPAANATGDGAIGSAIATGLTEACIMVSVAALLPRGILSTFRWSVVAKAAAAGAAMAAAVLLLPDAVPWVLRAVIALALYGAALWLTRPLEAGEERLLRDQAAFAVDRVTARFRRTGAPKPHQSIAPGP